MPKSTPNRLFVRTAEWAQVAERIHHVTALTSRLNLLPFEDSAGRSALLGQIFGTQLPRTVTLYPPFFTDYGLATTFDDNVFVNQGCTFMDLGGISIGADTMIGPNTHLITSGHPVPPTERREYIVAAPIVVQRGAWIGAGATILPGVTIGVNSVVGAGAVVSHDVPPNSLVTGPAAAMKKQWDHAFCPPQSDGVADSESVARSRALRIAPQ